MPFLVESVERRVLFSGELDPAFGSGGLVDTDFAAASEVFTQIALGPNGTTYAAGRLDAYTIAVARYTVAGQLDTTYGNGDGVNNDGIAHIRLTSVATPPQFTGPVGLAVAADGRAYVGSSLLSNGTTRMSVTALAANGSPDTAFNNGLGGWSGTLGGGRAAFGGLALDGTTLYAAGSDGRNLAALRFTAAGTPDTTFGTNGVARVDLGKTLVSGLSVVAAQVTRATGTPALVITGNGTRGGDNLPIAVVGELNAVDGSPRQGFQTTIVRVPWYGGGDFTASHMTVDSRGAVVLAGVCSESGVIARVLPTGGLDPGFSSYGSFIGGANPYLYDPNGGFASTEYASITSLATLRDGEIVFTVQRPGGTPESSREFVFALTRQGRFNEHFSPEREASGDLRGSIGVFVPPATSHFFSAVADASGRVVFAGTNTPAGGSADARLMRLAVQAPQPLVVSVGGTVYFDADADGVRDPTEWPYLPTDSAQARYTLYDDLNNDGVRGSGEPFVRMQSFEDAFVLEGEVGHTMRLRVVVPPGYRASPAEGVLVPLDADVRPAFAELGLIAVSALPAGTASMRGSVYDDINRNGAFDPAESPRVGRNVWLDLDNDTWPDTGEPITATGADGSFTFANLPAGTYVVRHTGAELANVSPTYPADGTIGVTLTTGEARTGLLFGQTDYRHGTVAGRVFVDANRNGLFDTGEAPMAGQVFVDNNYNGVIDGNDLFSATVDPATGLYSMLLPAVGLAYHVQFARGAGYAATTTASYDVTPTHDQTIADRDFGVVPVGASAGGTVFRDANGNGKQDSGETGMAGEMVYVDLDNDKVLDANETRTPTDAAGAFSFDGLPDTGSVTRLRVVVRSGVTQTTPANGFGFQLALTPGATNTGKLFGLYAPGTAVRALGSISGIAFDDRNKNGTFDGNDTVAAGKTIWLDLDDDGKVDANEPTYKTAADGKFAFTNLSARKYHVRRQFPGGYAESTPARYVTLTGGATVGGVAIGSRAK